MTDIFAELDADAARAQVTSAPTDAESSTVGRLGSELALLDERVAKGTALLKMLAERREQIVRKDLVDAMDAIGQDKMGLPAHNADIEIVDYVKAGLPNPDTAKTKEESERMAELRAEGLRWLSEEGHEDVINTTLAVVMPKGSLPVARIMARTVLELFDSSSTPESREAWLREADIEPGQDAKGLLAWLAARNEPGIDPGSASVQEGVHWATLTSLLKDLLRRKDEHRKNPDELPLEALGATVGRMAVIKPRKDKK